MSEDLSISLEALAALVGGQLVSGNKSTVIRGVASVSEAAGDEVTFLGNPRYLPELRRSRAAAVLVPVGFQEEVSAARIEVANPSVAFAHLVQRFAPPPPVFAPGVHPTAVLREGVVLGEGVSVQPYAVIEAGAQIGARTVIGAHAYIGHGARVGADTFLHPRVTVLDRCVLGARVIVHSGVVIGSDGFGFERVEGRHAKIPQVGIVQIDDDVEIGANTTIDRARFGRTWIQQGTKIDNLVQIAHNVVIGENCIVVAQTGISGSTRLGRNVTLAGQSGIVGHIEIGDGSVVTAQSGVSKSLPPNKIYMGTPAQPAEEFREQMALLRRLKRLSDRVQELETRLGPKAQ